MQRNHSDATALDSQADTLTRTPKLVINGKYALIWYALAVIIIVLDQWTKHLALEHLNYRESIPVIPFLNWTLLYNYGAAFSFLSDAGGWQKWFFTGLATAVSIFIIFWLTKIPRCAKLVSIGLGLILGGAIGNVIDRIQYGYVIDFIHFYYNSWHFPAFNIADTAICLGVFLLLIDAFFLEHKRHANTE